MRAEELGIGKLIKQRIKRVMVEGIPVLVLFVGIGLCVTASSHATVPAPVTPFPVAPAPFVVAISLVARDQHGLGGVQRLS